MTLPRIRVDGTALAHPKVAFAAIVTALTVVWLVYPVTRLEEWVGWFPTTMGTSQQGAVWLAPLVAGYAAWLSGQPRVHGFVEWASSSPRGAASRLLPSLLFAGAAVLLSQCISLLLIVSLSGYYGLGQGLVGLNLLLLVPTLTGYLLFWLACGALLGRSIRREIAVPASVFVPYLVYAVLAFYASDGPLAIFAVGDGRVFDYVRPSTTTVVVQCAFWSLAALAVWTFLLERRQLRQILTWSTSCAAAIAIFVGAAFLPIKGAQGATCTGNAPITCLDGSHATTMGRYRAELAKLYPSIPRALRPSAVGSSNTVLSSQNGPTLVIPPVSGYTEPSRVIDPTMFAARLGDALFIAPCLRESTAAQSSVPSSHASVTLNLWWRMREKVPVDGSAFVGDNDYTALPDYSTRREEAISFARLPQARQQKWFNTNAADILLCKESFVAED